MSRQFTVALAAMLLFACRSGDDTRAGSGPAGEAASRDVPPAAAPAPPPAPPAAPADDPCGRISKEDVAAAIGTQISLARVEAAGICAYFPDTSSTSNGVFVEVSSSSAYDAMKSALRRVEPVPGLGDDAFWTAPLLRVKSGDRMVVISIMDTRWNGGDSRGAATTIARKVLSHL